jgi:hypothetical protein
MFSNCSLTSSWFHNTKKFTAILFEVINKFSSIEVAFSVWELLNSLSCSSSDAGLFVPKNFSKDS